MSSETEIKAFVERILRLKDEQDALSTDIRDIYAEAKGMGFDKTALGNVVSHVRKIGKRGADTIAEQDANFEMYLAAYEGRPHAYAPAIASGMPYYDPVTGEVFEESPRKAAEAVPERAANQSLANGPCDAEAGRPALVGSATSSAVVGVLGQPETIPTLTGQHASANVSGPERAGVTAGETATVPEPIPNERCQSQVGCKFSHHPQKITCSTCTSAWAVKMKARQAA